MPKSFPFVLLPWVLATAALPAQTMHPGYKPDSAPPRRIVMSAPVDVPLVAIAGRPATPMVSVMVNGHGPYHFLIETGARLIGISGRIADSLGLPRAGGFDDDREFHIDSITLGGASFQDMPTEQLPFDLPGIDGVLGLPFYQDLLLTIDYPGRRARLSRDTLAVPDGQVILSLARVDDFWALPITIAGKPFDAVLDTQNSGVVGVPPELMDSLAFDGPLQAARARGASGLMAIKIGRLAGDIDIGKYAVQHARLAGLPLPPDFPHRPNIGNGVLEHFVMSLDQRHGRLRLQHDGPPVISLDNAASGRGGP